MKNNFRGKVVNLGLVGLLGLTGCADSVHYSATQPNDNSSDQTAMLGLGLIGLGYSRNNPGAMAVGRGLVDYGAAQAGRTQVNVNNNSYQSSGYEDSAPFKIITAYHNDQNRNEKVDGIHELGRPSNNFRVGERIAVVTNKLVNYPMNVSFTVSKDGLLEERWDRFSFRGCWD